MSSRYLTVLGTASQAPTRERAAGGYALQWDDQLVLFDPAEGFQRQCMLAGVVIGRATAVCITHFHGDHCLGLPGIIQRRALSQSSTKLPVYFPAEDEEVFNHLVHSSIYDDDFITPVPVSNGGAVGCIGTSIVLSEPLDHVVPTIGYRIQEPDRMGLNVAALAGFGISGPAVGDLRRTGLLRVGDREVRLEEVAEKRPGQAMAFVMDTRLCESAFSLAKNVDLLVSEATYLRRDQDLAHRSGHMTAQEAGWLASQAGARRLVISHFSGRYRNERDVKQEVGSAFDGALVAHDLQRIEVPLRIRSISRDQS